jgi:hypothetical protein
MHKNIPIVVGITILFLGLAIQPSIATIPPEKIDIEPDNLENRLTRKHVLNFVKGYLFIFESKIKKIVRRIILEIIVTGDATIDEIKEILNSVGINFHEIYILVEIKTTQSSSGSITCYPGVIRTSLIGYIARGSYVRCKRSDSGSSGWFLEINGNKVEEKSGHFFGYFGYVKSSTDLSSPEWYPPSYFSLDGFATLVFR